MNTLIRLTTVLLLSARCCTAFASVPATTDANREFIHQQESFSELLRNQDNAPLREKLEQQVRQNPLSASDSAFIGGLQQSQREVQPEKPTRGALYFVSFSIPPEALKRMLGEARRYNIPATLRGMVGNDMKTTAEAVISLVQDGATSGVQIDPTQYRQFGISSVPALVVYCGAGHDVVRGNLHLKQALEKMVEKGVCAQDAQQLLNKGDAH